MDRHPLLVLAIPWTTTNNNAMAHETSPRRISWAVGGKVALVPQQHHRHDNFLTRRINHNTIHNPNQGLGLGYVRTVQQGEKIKDPCVWGEVKRNDALFVSGLVFYDIIVYLFRPCQKWLPIAAGTTIVAHLVAS